MRHWKGEPRSGQVQGEIPPPKRGFHRGRRAVRIDVNAPECVQVDQHAAVTQEGFAHAVAA